MLSIIFIRLIKKLYSKNKYRQITNVLEKEGSGYMSLPFHKTALMRLSFSMKSLNISGILATLFFLFLTGCKKTDKPVERTFLTVGTTELEQIADNKAATIIVPVKTNIVYIATPAAGWITVTGKSNTSLTLQLSENVDSDIREGTVVLTGDGVSPVTIKVKQGGVAPFALMSPAVVNLAENRVFTIKIETNIQYTLSKPDWLTIKASTARAVIRTDEYTYEASVSISDRSGEIILTGNGTNGNVTGKIKVNQTGQPPVITNEWAANPYKLNVVYFIPNDIDSVPHFRERLSKILLEGQKFYAGNLQREGFGRSSFGLDLLTDDSVNIVVIMGNKGKSAYPYTGGGTVVQGEVDAYFAANPGKKKSDHYLIILPSTSGDPLSPGGVPFYGQGRYCYALDYETMEQKYLGQSGTHGNMASKWIGGLMHELGHGINCPHNWGTKSATAAYGTALMGAGNLTYGKSPTFITKTSAAIFANGQTFSKETRTDWYQNFTFSLSTLTAKLQDGNKIVLSGKFTTAKQISHVLAYFDRTPYGGNLDYDAITFGEPAIGNDSFHIVCPLTEFQNLTDEYQLRLHFLGVNGTRKTESFIFSFENNQPVLTNVFRAGLSNRSTWTAASSGNQTNSGPGNLLDGDLSTNWHTPWNPVVKPPPHWFSVDTKTNTTFNTLVMHNRSNLAGALKDFHLKTSNDGNNWTTIGTYTLPQNAGANYVLLPGIITARYVQVESVSMYGGDGYTHLAEFDLYLR